MVVDYPGVCSKKEFAFLFRNPNHSKITAE
jgi:hypothetical protein